MQTYLEKRDAATNQARYYRILVLPNLFGAWTLYREWDRIGQGGKVRMEWFETYFDRIEACCEAAGRKHAQSKTLDGLPDGIRIHRCEHHYIVWLDGDRLVIIAILHERMDFVRQLKDRL
jgi:predicted DNA-binding WGR domain protein